MFAYLVIVLFLGTPGERPMVVAPAPSLAACDARVQELQADLDKQEGAAEIRPYAVCYKAQISTKM
jgi:predicted proteasome-type protease